MCGDVADDLDSGPVGSVDIAGLDVDVDDRTRSIGVPQLLVVLDRVVVDRNHQVGLVEKPIGRLIVEQPDLAREQPLMLS
jgi:hypothetical protein